MMRRLGPLTQRKRNKKVKQWRDVTRNAQAVEQS